MNETIKRIQNGEKELLTDFILDNYKYIWSFIEKYEGAINDFEDLKQEVLICFIKVVYNYNFKSEFLKSYARIHLHTCVERYLSKHIEDFKDYDARYAFCVRLYELAKRKLGHNPSLDELRKTLFINESNAYKIVNVINNPSIYNERYTEDVSFINFLDEELCDKIKRNELIKNSSITKRQKELLLFHYGFNNGENYSFSEMARILNSDRQVYSRANENLLKRVKKRISE